LNFFSNSNCCLQIAVLWELLRNGLLTFCMGLLHAVSLAFCWMHVFYVLWKQNHKQYVSCNYVQ